MARDPHEAVDFAPAWLNFNNSNKKKTEKSSGIHGSSQPSSLNPPLKSSQEPIFRSSLGARVGGSPSRSTTSVVSHWGHQSPSGRTSTRHQSVEFSPSYGDKIDLFSLSPSKDHKNTFTRLANYSPTFSSAKRDFSSIHPRHVSRNAQPPARPLVGMGDGSSALDTDFPSLCDIDISDQNKVKHQNGQSSPPVNVVNMWKNPLVVKATESQTGQNANPATKSQAASSIYKTLVPKSANHQKQPYRRTMSVPLNLPSKSGNSIGELITSGSKREHSAIGHQNQVMSGKVPDNTSVPKRTQARTSGQRVTLGKTLSVEIGVVSAHKKHRKGKSHFLKTLCQTESGEDDSAGRVNFSETSDGSVQQTVTGVHPIGSSGEMDIPKNVPQVTMSDNFEQGATGLQNVFHDQGSTGSFHQLSSSLEAEHRLLREMGWNTDEQAMEEDSPLTEDEIREFKVKCNGLLSSQASGRRKEAFNNAFSDWKFSGIRKKSSDAQNGHDSSEDDDDISFSAEEFDSQ